MEDLYRSQFRLPYDLYERLKSAAHQEGRSVNAEVVARLQQTFAGGARADYEARLADMAAHFERRVGQLEADMKRYVDERTKSAGSRPKGGRRPAK